MNTWTPELKKRVATAVGGGTLVLLLIIFGGSIGAFLLVSVISLAMVFEFTDMVYSYSDKLEKRYLMLALSWFLALLNFILPGNELSLLSAAFALLFGYFLYTADRYPEGLNPHFRELCYSVFGLVYLVFIPSYFVRIHQSLNGVHWIIIFLLINWAGDSAAYFVGVRWGRRRLYPLISPNKSVEGAIGGLVAGVVVTLLYKLLLFKGGTWIGCLVMASCVGAIAQIGDLCESFLKRAYDRKDSGAILPGHGGFLDRFDGIIFSLPVMFAFVRLLG